MATRELTVNDIAGIAERFGLSVRGRTIRGASGQDLTQEERDLALSEHKRLRNSPPPVPGPTGQSLENLGAVMPGGGESQQSTISGDPVPDLSRDTTGMEGATAAPPHGNMPEGDPRNKPVTMPGTERGSGLGFYPNENSETPGYDLRFSEDRPIFMSNEKWDTLSSTQKLDNILRFGGHAIAAMTGMGEAGHEAVENPKTALATAAPGGVKPAWNFARQNLLPNKANAGPIFEFILGKAKESPIKLDNVLPILSRLKELDATGGGSPRVVRALAKRLERFRSFIDKDTGVEEMSPQLTYREARDFYSNISRLAGQLRDKAGTQVSSSVAREVGKLRQALSDDIMSGLESVSKVAKTGGDDLAAMYQRAMTTYAKGAQFDEQIARLGKVWERAWPYTVGGTVAGGILAGTRTIGEFLGLKEPAGDR